MKENLAFSNSEVYTVDEVQNVLRIGRKTVYELMKDPPFPVRKVLNQYRIPKVEFDGWLHNKSTDYLGEGA